MRYSWTNPAQALSPVRLSRLRKKGPNPFVIPSEARNLSGVVPIFETTS
jgi:hypothetical protein